MIPVKESTVLAALALQDAYDRRCVPGWPATLLGALMHPIYSRLLLLELQHGASEPVRVRDPVIRPEPPTESAARFDTVTKPTNATVTKREIDRKSLAAGEKPDD
jgi:hypothetical protein